MDTVVTNLMVLVPDSIERNRVKRSGNSVPSAQERTTLLLPLRWRETTMRQLTQYLDSWLYSKLFLYVNYGDFGNRANLPIQRNSQIQLVALGPFPHTNRKKKKKKKRAASLGLTGVTTRKKIWTGK